MTNEQIKDLVLIALASDDDLLETLVLKGGNAISLLERGKSNKLSRTSYDLDFSIENDFDGNLEEIKDRIERTIMNTFQEKGYFPFDYAFNVQPSKINEKVKDFWGGYCIEFKIIGHTEYNKYKDNIDDLRKYAVPILPNRSPKIEIEISKYEYVEKKIEAEVDGFIIYIYSPEMIVFEKLRAICQQLPNYREIIPSFSPRARARDFYDIYLICEQHTINTHTEESISTLRSIFEAKKVPVSFITHISSHSDLHRANWQSVIDTVSAKEEVKPFDFYLNFLLEKFGNITFP